MRAISKKMLAELNEVYQTYQDLSPKDADTFGQLDRMADGLLPHSLAEEQGFICCYCMSEIKAKTYKDSQTGEIKEILGQDGKVRLAMKIEHFKPQSIYDGGKHASNCDQNDKKRQDLRTDYKNLLCACEGCSNSDLHCDTHKGNAELCHLPNPASLKDKAFRQKTQFTYNKNGKMASHQADLNREIGGEQQEDGNYHLGVLNLNCEALRIARKTAWKTVSSRITRKLGYSDWNNHYTHALELAKQEHALFQKRKKADNKFFPYCEAVVYLLEKRFKELRSK